MAGSVAGGVACKAARTVLHMRTTLDVLKQSTGFDSVVKKVWLYRYHRCLLTKPQKLP